MCREMNFAFCVEASMQILETARNELASDLPDDVASASTSQVSAMAVVADRFLTRLYKKLVEESEPSQTCLHYWRLAACSETFSVLGTTSPTKLCFATCHSVQRHCASQFLTPSCQATLQYGDATVTGCSDYATLVGDDVCVIGDSNQPQQSTTKPRGVETAPSTKQFGTVVTRKPTARSQQSYSEPVAGSTSKQTGVDFCLLLVIFFVGLAVLLECF